MKNEKPIYYAKVKGWEHLSPSDCFWNYGKETGKYVLANNFQSSHFITQLTKDAWNALGINDTNADFEKVEE